MPAFLLTCLTFFLFSTGVVSAIYDPLSVPNNKFGVHVLDTSEIFEAAKLVNSQGGDWGYVTIPIRTDDRDKPKWTGFMLAAKQNRVIPILRISSYASGANWVSPPVSELIDFANFLSDLPWPVKNRYIIIYNEPNHSQEWGGYVSPSEYTRILVTARDIFKSRSQDFFLISAGMDMSAPTTATSLDALRYFRLMSQTDKSWYSAIDGLSVHAYPNPGFISSAWSSGRYGITSYRYEVSLLGSLGYPSKPIFITETGYLGRDPFYQAAFEKIWIEPNIIAVTPFVLFAGTGEFSRFSLLDRDRKPTASYSEIFLLPKLAGSPLLNDDGSFLQSDLSYTSGSAPDQNKTGFIRRILNFIFPPKPTVTMGRNSIRVEVVVNLSDQIKGLSDRKSLPRDSGMLFAYPKSQIRTFWMKDMNFPLDIIWINEGKIVHIHEKVPPPADSGGIPVIVSSGVPVDHVLEVNSGFVSDRGIRIGDPFMIN